MSARLVPGLEETLFLLDTVADGAAFEIAEPTGTSWTEFRKSHALNQAARRILLFKAGLNETCGLETNRQFNELNNRLNVSPGQNERYPKIIIKAKVHIPMKAPIPKCIRIPMSNMMGRE